MVTGVQTCALPICWEAVAAYFTLNLPVRIFFQAFSDMLRWGDLVGGVTKTAFFGLAISVVSTAAGLRATGGARGVGQAAAASVVTSCAAIFALDFMLTPVLSRWFG